jgi:hypothetical protein
MSCILGCRNESIFAGNKTGSDFGAFRSRDEVELSFAGGFRFDGHGRDDGVDAVVFQESGCCFYIMVVSLQVGWTCLSPVVRWKLYGRGAVSCDAIVGLHGCPPLLSAGQDIASPEDDGHTFRVKTKTWCLLLFWSTSTTVLPTPPVPPATATRPILGAEKARL